MKPLSIRYGVIATLDAAGGHLGVLTIRNVDDDVIAALKRRAKANHRSLEGELRHLLARHAVPKPTLGVVREQARMAARYQVTSAVPKAAPDAADAEAARGHVPAEHGAWLGAMSDVGEIVGDIVSPAADSSEWAALHSEADASNDDPTR